MATAPDPQVCELLAAAGESLGEEMYERMTTKGFADIRPSHGKNVLRHLSPDGTRLTDLAEKAGMTKQAMGELITHLEDAGYVERRPCCEDGRAKIVVPTARGREAKAAARECLTEIHAEWHARLGDERMDALRSALETIQRRKVPSPA